MTTVYWSLHFTPAVDCEQMMHCITCIANACDVKCSSLHYYEIRCTQFLKLYAQCGDLR